MVGNFYRSKFALCIGVQPSALMLLFDFDLSGLRFEVTLNKWILLGSLGSSLVFNVLVVRRKCKVETVFRHRWGDPVNGRQEAFIDAAMVSVNKTIEILRHMHRGKSN